MKKILCSILGLVCATHTFAQINTIKTATPAAPVKKNVQVLPYDGKSNLSQDNVLAHKGETLYLLFNKRKDTKGYAMFFTQPGFSRDINIGWDNSALVYAPQDGSDGVVYSNADSLREKYYYVNNILQKDPTDALGDICLQLVEKQSADTLYFRMFPSMSHRFLTLRYFENMQKEYVGKKYYARNFLNEINVTTGEMINVPKETLLTCKALGIDDGKIIYVMEAAGLGQIKATKGEMNTECDLDRFETLEEYSSRKNNKSPNAAGNTSNYKLNKDRRTITY